MNTNLNLKEFIALLKIHDIVAKMIGLVSFSANNLSTVEHKDKKAFRLKNVKSFNSLCSY